MASISSVSQFPTNSVSSMSPSSKLSPNFLKLMANSMRFPLKNSAKSKFAIGVQNKFNFSWRAASEDELDPESKDSSLQAPVVEKEELTEAPAVEELAEAPAVEELTEAPVVEEEEPTEAPLLEEEEEELTVIDSLKKQLVDTFLGTNGGLTATSETTAEIVELITLLEAKNPTPEPTKTLPLLNGKWILVYTSFLGLHPLLSSGTLPLSQVDEISQTIDSDNFTVQNCVVFSSLGSKTSFTTNATFEVRSPKRVQIKFEEGIIGTPQLTESIELPESVEVLGQTIDLSPFKELITSVEDTASNVAKTISSQPPWKFSISQTNSESWLLTTYLDEELRISRGDRGEVFVLFKEGSPRLSS